MAASNFTPPPTYADPVIVDEATNKARFNPIWLKWFVDMAAVISAAGGGGGGIFHNLLSGLQGGTAAQYYHMTSTEHTLFTGTKTANTFLGGPIAGAAATPTFRNLVTADLPAGLGTVTSVAQTFTGGLISVAGSPVTTTGTLD